ncbi:MAG: hypothetical protein RL325_1839 [Planctomycetota bacterium]|jgi:hypothetical protein
MCDTRGGREAAARKSILASRLRRGEAYGW